MLHHAGSPDSSTEAFMSCLAAPLHAPRGTDTCDAGWLQAYNLPVHQPAEKVLLEGAKRLLHVDTFHFVTVPALCRLLGYGRPATSCLATGLT